MFVALRRETGGVLLAASGLAFHMLEARVFVLARSFPKKARNEIQLDAARRQAGAGRTRPDSGGSKTE